MGQSFYTDDQSVSEERLGQSFYTDDQSCSEERLGQSFYTDDQSASEERLGQSFYTMVDDVADRIADKSEIRRGKQFVLEQIG